jgi:CHAT domain-containing protein/Tfp pilus assembly protein PilF
VLAPGAPIKGSIRTGESHSFAIRLQKNQYLRVGLEQRGIDLNLTLWNPGGKKIATGGPSSRQQWTILSLITSEAGAYGLRVAAPAAAGTTGRYRLVIEDRRAAVSGDRSRVAAQEKLSQGLRARDQPKGLPEALLRLGEALPLWREAGDVPGEVDTLNEIGETEFYLDELDQARGHFESSLALALQVRYTRGQAQAWNDLGGVLSRQEPPTAALEPYRKALVLWKELGEVGEQGTTLVNMGDLVRRSLYDLDQASRSFNEALPLVHEAGDQTGEADSLTGLGLIAQGRGDLDGALRRFGDALGLSKAGDRQHEATILTNMADIHLARGNLQKALELYDAALASGGAGDQVENGRLLHNLASLYAALGQPEQALLRYQRALDHQRKNPTATAITLNSIATLSAASNPVNAGETLTRALKISRDARQPAIEALTLHNLGSLHRSLGETEVALTELREALVLRDRLPDLLDRARTRLELATAEAQLHRTGQAAASVRQALELARRVRARSVIARCLLLQATLDRDGGDLERARREIEEALRVVETVRSDVGTDELRTSYFAAQRSYYDFYVDLLMRLSLKDRRFQVRALAASEQTRARGLLDLLAEGRIDVASGIDPELKRREIALASELAWTEGQLKQVRQAATPDEAAAKRLEDRLLAIEQQQQALIGEIRNRNPRYAEVRYPPALDGRSIQARLDSQSALLEYAVGEEVTFLFVVTHEGLDAYRLPFGAKALGERVERLRKSLKTPGRSLRGNYLQEAVALYRDLIGPAERRLTEKRTWLVSPDSILHLLPFEALLTQIPKPDEPDSGLPFLLRRHAIAYVPSASVLAGLEKPHTDPVPRQQAEAPAFLAFANPAYPQGKGTPELPLLPGSESEVQAIARLYPAGNSKLYLGREATKDNVMGNGLLEHAVRVQFATHGFLDEARPQLSSLALAPGRAPGDDGFLRVHEIFDLKLNADLVVLSACDTSGAQVTGEGLVGLTRAFFYAGASSLVVSLWRAQDVSTPELMAGFYRQLVQGKAEALRSAKLEMIAAGRYAHPSYWAPFILVGDPR